MNMSPVKNGRLLFNDFPENYPIPGKTTIYDDSETIDLESAALNGGFLLKVLNVSIDPYLRNKMRRTASYRMLFEIGKPLYNFGVGVVLRSEHTEVAAGDHVYGILPFQQYVIKPSLEGLRIIKNEENLPWSVYIGALGMPGQTAYYAWKEYANPQKGEVAFISTAAGTVGSFVVQLAKASGLKVIASAGSDEKVEWVKSLGADVAFNYKTQDMNEILAKEGPVNIYWDNVGGDTLDAALGNAAQYARFIECGMISGYNVDYPPVKNLMSIVFKEIKIFGFVVSSLAPKYAEEFYREVPKLVANGTIKYAEDITKGVEFAGHALEAVQRGTNKAKSVIIVNED